MLFAEILQLIHISLRNTGSWDPERHGKLAEAYCEACRSINSGSLPVFPEELPAFEEHLAWAEFAFVNGCDFPPRPMPPPHAALMAALPPEAGQCSSAAELERLYRSRIRILTLEQRMCFLRRLAAEGTEWAKSDIISLMPEWGQFLRDHAHEAYKNRSAAELNAVICELKKPDVFFLKKDEVIADCRNLFDQLISAEKSAVWNRVLYHMEEADKKGSVDVVARLTAFWEEELAKYADDDARKRYTAVMQKHEKAAAIVRQQEYLNGLMEQLRQLVSGETQLSGAELKDTIKTLCDEIFSSGGDIPAEMGEALEEVRRKDEAAQRTARNKIILWSCAVLSLLILALGYSSWLHRQNKAFESDIVRLRNLQQSGDLTASAEFLQRVRSRWSSRSGDPALRDAAALQNELEEAEETRASAFAAAAAEFEEMRKKDFIPGEEAYRIIDVLAANASTDEETAYCNESLEAVLNAESSRQEMEKKRILQEIEEWKQRISAVAAEDLSNNQKIFKLSHLRKEISRWAISGGISMEVMEGLAAEIDGISRRINSDTAFANELNLWENKLLQARLSREDFFSCAAAAKEALAELAPDWSAAMADIGKYMPAAAEIAAAAGVGAGAVPGDFAEVPDGAFWHKVASNAAELEKQLAAENEIIKGFAGFSSSDEKLFSLQFEAADGSIYEYFLAEGSMPERDSAGISGFTAIGVGGTEKLCRFRPVDGSGGRDWWFEHADRIEIKLKDMTFVPASQHFAPYLEQLPEIWGAENTPLVKAQLAEWMGRTAADKNINPVLFGRRFQQYRDFLLPEDDIENSAAFEAFSAWFAASGPMLYDLPANDFLAGKKASGLIGWEGIAAYWRNAAAGDKRKEILAWDQGALDMRWMLAGCEYPSASGDMLKTVFAYPEEGQIVWRMVIGDSGVIRCEYAGKWGGAAVIDYKTPAAPEPGTAYFLFAGNGKKNPELLMAELTETAGACPAEAMSAKLWRNIQ